MLSLTTHHIGYLVKNMNESIKQFKILGYQLTNETITDQMRQIYITFLCKDGYRVELIQPISETSVVAGLMKKHKNSPYHICYTSDCFIEDTGYLTSHGYLAIDEPLAAPACDGHNVQFFIHPELGMIEIMDIHS